MTNTFKNRAALMAAKTQNTTHYVLLPKRFELGDSDTAWRTQLVAEMSAREKDYGTLEEILTGFPVTAAEFEDVVNNRSTQFVKIVAADNCLIDPHKWVIDFIAFPTADYHFLETMGLI